MNHASLGFSHIDERKDHPALFARWLLSRSLTEHWPGLCGMEFLCSLCGAVARIADTDPNGSVDFREGVACAHCGMSARLRSCLSMLGTLADTTDRIYVTEQATPTFAWLQARYPQAIGSEFEPDSDRREAMAGYLAGLGGHGAIQFEDVTRLSMADASLDAVACFDVLEHVPDYRAALHEFARVLREDGTLLATFPFTDGSETLVRASFSKDGTIQHHLEPEYHGDPIGKPVLCFYHFGWNLLEEARAAGFASARMLMPWSPEQGVFYGNWMLVAAK